MMLSRIARRSFLAAAAIMFSILGLLSVEVSASLGTPVTCYLLTQSVTIDGKWSSATEWNDAPEIQMLLVPEQPYEGTTIDANALGYFRVKHDATTLYILGESLVHTDVEYTSTLVTRTAMGDYVMLFLDPLYNQGKTPQTDDYTFIASYVSPSYTTIMTWKGDGAKWTTTGPVQGVQVMVGLDTGNSPHGLHPHATFEMSIPLSLIPASQSGFFIRFSDVDEGEMVWYTYYWPGPTQAQQALDPSSWGTLTISSTPIPEFPSWFIAVVAAFAVLISARVYKRDRPE